MRHVLEHMQNPYEFLNSIKESNDGKGLIYIEVPCFDWINNNNSFMDIYYEHVNYFRKIDFKNMFENIIDIGNVFSGQYLYVVADLSSLKKPIRKDSFILNKSFSDKLYYYKDMILNSNKKSVIWGCGPRAQILSFLLRKLSVNINYFVDINPAREGKYLALVDRYANLTGGVVSSNTLLKEVEENEGLVFVMNSNYLEEIKEMSNNKYTYITLD